MREGASTYGDNLRLPVEPTEDGHPYPAGTGFDATADEATEWYQRTEEDGNPVDFDYETNQCIDDEDSTRADTAW